MHVKVVGADEIAGGGRIIGPNPMDSANQEPGRTPDFGRPMITDGLVA